MSNYISYDNWHKQYMAFGYISYPARTSTLYFDVDPYEDGRIKENKRKQELLLTINK